MAKFRPAINSMATGEIMPEMHGRWDHQKYASALARCRNMISRPHGCVYRRPGTIHVHAAKYSDKKARFIEFDFNSTESQAYVIELGHQYMRFYTADGVVLSGSTVYELATPWTEDQIWAVSYHQSSDVVFMAHSAVAPRKLIRKDHADWELVTLDFRLSGHDLSIADGNSDGKADGKQNDTLTLPASRKFTEKMIVKGVTPSGETEWFEYHGDGYWEAPAGSALTITFKDTPSTSSGNTEIKSVYTSAGVLNTDWHDLDTDNSAPDYWTGSNWPALVRLYEDRLVLGADPEHPTLLHMSRNGEYTDFRKNTADSGEPLDDDSIWKKAEGAKPAPLRWLMGGNDLLAGTSSSELRIWSGTDGTALTPADCISNQQGAIGSADMPARMAGNSVLYVSFTGRKLFRISFDFGSYKYTSREVSLMAQHIPGGGLVDMAYCVEPDGVLWAARKDGLLAACTYLPEEDVSGWHLHELGGGGKVESVASIPGERGHELWLLVRRLNADGTVRRDVERMVPRFIAQNDDGSIREDASEALFVDSGVTYRGANVTSLSGLGHLEGKTVQVLANGSVMPERVVQSGSISLDKPASLVHVGLASTAEIVSLPLEIPLQSGTSQSMKKRVVGVWVHLMDSIGGEAGTGPSDARNYEALLPDVASITPGLAPKLESGRKYVAFSEGYEDDAVVAVRQSQPLPMTIVCLIPEVVIG